MITGNSFQKYINKTCGIIRANFIENEEDSYWELLTLDPKDGDHFIVLAKLYYNTLILKINEINASEDIMLDIILGGGIYCRGNFKTIPKQDIKTIYCSLTDEDLFDIIMELLIENFTDKIKCLNCILKDIIGDAK